MLHPAARLPRDGFTVDQTFHTQIANNAQPFSAFPSTRELYLPGGAPPVVGTTFTNPDLATTYETLARQGARALYRGPIAEEIAATVQQPPVDPAGLNVRPGKLITDDIAAYRTVEREPTRTRYRGLDVYGMPAPSSSGGLTVGEALNILENFDVARFGEADYLHHFPEASRLAFADRNRWIGDPAFVDVPARELLSRRFADSRACLIDPSRAAVGTVAAGDPRHLRPCAAGTAAPTPYEGARPRFPAQQRADRLLIHPRDAGRARPEPARPRQAPAVVDGADDHPGARQAAARHWFAGWRVDHHHGAAGAAGAARAAGPRADAGGGDRRAAGSQRNSGPAQVDPAFLALPEASDLRSRGQLFSSSPAEIGAATGVERLPDGRWLAAAEPVRRGGGAAQVVHPVP